MASITGMIPQDSLVLRDGHQKSIPASELVVGNQYQFQPNWSYRWYRIRQLGQQMSRRLSTPAMFWRSQIWSLRSDGWKSTDFCDDGMHRPKFHGESQRWHAGNSRRQWQWCRFGDSNWWQHGIWTNCEIVLDRRQWSNDPPESTIPS